MNTDEHRNGTAEAELPPHMKIPRRGVELREQPTPNLVCYAEEGS